jgi:hypothetical protein
MVHSMRIAENSAARIFTYAFVTVASAACFATSAVAFDPNEGAEEMATTQPTGRYQTYTPTDGSRYARGQGLPASVVPKRYYAAPAAPSGATAAYSPTATLPTTTMSPAYIPTAKSSAPVFIPAGQESIYNAAPYNAAPAAAAPIAPTPIANAQPAYSEPPRAQQPAYDAYPATPTQSFNEIQPDSMTPVAAAKRNHYYVGIEGFYDIYKEDVVSLDSRSVYGAVDAGFTHYFNSEWFAGSELRVSYGKEDYESPSGTIDGVDQWEVEHRITGGYDFAMGGGSHMKTFVGLNTRYYRDEGKGEVTNLGANAYDRRILQFFMPIGVTYEFKAYGYRMAPTIEYDHLLYGRVESRLQNVPGYYQATNFQKTGYGLRAEFMISKTDNRGNGWEFGPFVRYWHLGDSDIDTTAPTPDGNQWLEPDNDRLQLGAKLKLLF